MNNTLVVNLYGGPGTGKSTIAAGLFYELKNKGVRCELALEKAKEYVWEQRDVVFKNQIYIFAQQHHRIFRLLNQVDVIITDSPLLLTPIYDEHKRESLAKLALVEHDAMWNLDVCLKRVKPYDNKGRLAAHDTLKKVRLIDDEIIRLLVDCKVRFMMTPADKMGMEYILKEILRQIAHPV